MVDLFDEKAVVSAAAQGAISRLVNAIEGRARGVWASWKNEDPNAFQEYLFRQARACRQVRNSILRFQTHDLLHIYVEMRFNNTSRIRYLDSGINLENTVINTMSCPVTDPSFSRPLPALLCRGAAGMGKSLFLRRVFLHFAYTDSGFIPLFLELRELNRSTHFSVIDSLYEQVCSMENAFSRERFDAGLEAGLFLLIFDGFDEISIDYQSMVEKAILSISKKYDHCPILVAGRPLSRFATWSTFDVIDILPLNIQQATILIEKSQISEIDRSVFIKRLRGEYFHTHQEFASNPLLLLIMYLTFCTLGPIAQNLHQFLDDAFETLYVRHDATKEGLARTHFTRLSKQQMLSVLSMFGALSYVENTIYFRGNELDRYLDQAIEMSGVQTNVESLKNDLLISFCLLVDEGNRIKFTHRLFQEYLAAVYVGNLPDEEVAATVDEVVQRSEADNVIQIALGLHEEKIERLWVLEKFRDNELSLPLDNYENYVDLLEVFFGIYSESPHLLWGDREELTREMELAVGGYFSISRLNNVIKNLDALLFVNILRHIYQFDPNNNELLIYWKSIRQSGVLPGSEHVVDEAPGIGYPLHRDFANVKRLKKHLVSKYRRKGAGRRLILDRTRTHKSR